MGKKILTIVGARPQFIKSAPVSWALHAAGLEELILHTGQHYDDIMSDVFFRDLSLPAPAFQLGVGSASHGRQTARMLEGTEDVLLQVRPDLVLVYGDTNSTLAGALAACKLEIPVAHVEAGLRSFNRAMPEEHNRVLTDHCATLLCCPTDTAVSNLAREGITSGVHLVGDTMFDVAMKCLPLAHARSDVLRRLDLKPKTFGLATIHRASTTDDPAVLKRALAALGAVESRIILPLHPRTAGKMTDFNLRAADNTQIVEPLSYLDMLVLEQAAALILTDSGGVQKEAYFLHTPCVTLRSETEWVETVASGWNIVTGLDREAVRRAADMFRRTTLPDPLPIFGDGHAAERVVETLSRWERS